MEREPAVYSDESTQEAYTQHSLHSRLNRPNSLPVFHIGPQSNQSSPFRTPYGHEGKYQHDAYKQYNKQSNFIIGDPMLVNQPHHAHSNQHGSPKFHSPQFVGDLRREMGFAFRHPALSEPTNMFERNVPEYSPLSLKFSPMFPYDVPLPFEERQQMSPYAKESRNQTVLSSPSNFFQHSYRTQTDASPHHMRTPSFHHDKNQSKFTSSPVDLKLLEYTQIQSHQKEAKSGCKMFGNRPAYHKGNSPKKDFAPLASPRKDQFQSNVTTKVLDTAPLNTQRMIHSSFLQDHESQTQHINLLDTRATGISNHELNLKRKSVICTSSKEEGAACDNKDSQISSNDMESWFQLNSPNTSLNASLSNKINSGSKLNERPSYLDHSPSKRSRFGMDTCRPAPNLFESVFNVKDSSAEIMDSKSRNETFKMNSRDFYKNGGNGLKSFREKFLLNNCNTLEREELLEKAAIADIVPSSYHTKDHERHNIAKNGNDFQRSLDNDDKGNKPSGNNANIFHLVEVDTIKKDLESSQKSFSQHQSLLQNVARIGKNSKSIAGEDHVISRLVIGEEKRPGNGDSTLNGAMNPEPKVKKADIALFEKTDIANFKSESNNREDNGKKSIKEHEKINNFNQNFSENERYDSGRTEDGNVFLDGSEEKDGSAQLEPCSPPRESVSSEDLSPDDTVVKRTLSREERAIQYAVERFKKMEEKTLGRKAGKRRGNREIKEEIKENQDDVNKNKDDDYDIQKVEIKHEAKKTKSNPKMKKAIACTKKNCDDEGNCKEVRDGTENKHVNKNGFLRHPKVGCKKNNHKDTKQSKDFEETHLPKGHRNEESVSKKIQSDSITVQDSLNEKDLSRVKQEMQQKSYLLVPSYKGFKDFSPVVLEGRTRQRSTQSDAEKIEKKKFPILVVETVGEKRNEILVRENEDLDAKIAKESLLAEKVFEHEDIEDGKTSVVKHLSCNRMTGETVLHKAARLGYDDVVDIKIKEGADVNAKDNAGWTPLHEACLRGKTDVVKVLLRYGADPNCRSESGIRPLHDAIDSNNIDIIRLLLSYGADISLETYSGVKAFQLARSKEVKDFLRGYIGDIKEPKLLENCCDYMEDRWPFRGTSAFLDAGVDDTKQIFRDMPSISDVQIEFVASSNEFLPTYNLPVYDEDTVVGYRNYYILEDVLSHLSTSRGGFLKKHKVELRVLRMSEIMKFLSYSQITSLPNQPTSSSQSEDPVMELVHIGPYAARKLFDLKAYFA